MIIILIAILIFAIVGFIGGLVVGLHETVGWIINIGTFISAVVWILWDWITNPDVTTTKTNWEEFTSMILSIVCVFVVASSWIIGEKVGKIIKLRLGGKER
jgi:uncharacterized membrane protein required for colicin V production